MRYVQQSILLFVLGCAAQPLLAADDNAASPAACLQNIRVVCSGLEDHLETCAQQRAERFADGCRAFLQNAIDQSSRSGVGDCVQEFKRVCGAVDAAGLGQCIIDKRSQFSAACQKYLSGSSNAPAQ